MKLGSLFDGSGGFPLAGSFCGIEPVWAAEVEPYPIAVTTSRFPKMRHLGSVTDIDGAKVEPVDIITFGSPCQDLSVAGKRAGLKHEANGDEETTRSGLFMEAVRIIREMREATNGRYPAFALWENVPGAFSSNKGEDFRTVLEELIKIVEPSAVMPPVPKNGWPYADCYMGDGWSLAYRVFDAQYWGVPQRRRRIHLVLHLTGQCAGQVLFEREGLRGHLAESRTAGQTVAGDAERSIAAADRAGTAYTLEPGIAAREGGHIYEGVSGTLRANAGDNQMAVACAVNIVLDDQGGSQINIRLDGKSPTLRAEMHGNVPSVLASIQIHDKATRYQVGFAMQGFGDYKESEVAGGLKARDHKDATDLVVYRDPQYIVRRLTPTECARLQGFPDEWGHPVRKEELTEQEYAFWLNVRNTHAAINGKAVKEYTKDQMLAWYNKLHTDSAEYKMWGNGIALPPALYVMEGIAETERMMNCE